MDAQAVATVGAVVTVLTQVLKKALPGERLGPYVAGAVSFVCVLLWVVSDASWPPKQTDIWSIFSGWVAVFATSAGIYSLSNIPTSGGSEG